MTNETIKTILIQKGINFLYHANSVATASTFLENGGLLSRGYVEENGLFQTPQETDERDKHVDVFYDIFFDSVDIHQRINNINYYGPVVFVYSINVIDMLEEGRLKITKNNPIYWDYNIREDEKYFLSETELMMDFQKGEFRKHITIRHQKTPLSFVNLKKIIIDDPGIANTSYFQSARSHLQDLIKKHGINVPLDTRCCSPNCRCKATYYENLPKTRELYVTNSVHKK